MRSESKLWLKYRTKDFPDSLLSWSDGILKFYMKLQLFFETMFFFSVNPQNLSPMRVKKKKLAIEKQANEEKTY